MVRISLPRGLAVWRDWWEQQQESQLFAPSFMQAVNEYSGFVPDMQNVFPNNPANA